MYLKVSELKFKYDKKGEWISNNINFSIDEGSILAILGESGSGKSTVLRLIAGLEKPFDGKIIVEGQSLVDASHFVEPEKRGIGMVFQDYALFPHMTVEKNIQFGIEGLSRKEIKERVKEVLHLVSLEGLEKRYPHELSGGQQQRVALARALAPKPKLLLLDEPFSNLDAHLHEQIREDLKKILVEAGITSVFVTHDKEDALSIATDVVVLDKGLVIKSGTSDILL